MAEGVSMPRDGRRGRLAIEIATVGDGVVRVDMTELVDAYERTARRWSRARLVGAILGSVTVAGSLALGVLAIRWDAQHRRDVQVLKFVLRETETRVMCWRAMPSRWNPTREDIVTVDGHEAWVRGCVQRELGRQGDGALGIRDRALMKPKKVNHDEAVLRAYER